jgi:hypothetical protein
MKRVAIFVVIWSMIQTSTLSAVNAYPQTGFWGKVVEFLVEFVAGESLETLMEKIVRSRKELKEYSKNAKLIPLENERGYALFYCQQADQALERLENYIKTHQNDHEEIKKFLLRLNEEQLQPLAERMDAVETRLEGFSSWQRKQEKRERDWDVWRRKIDVRVDSLRRDIRTIKRKEKEMEMRLEETEKKLKDIMRTRIIFSLYYQRLDISPGFWKQEFDETPVVQLNNEEYDGIGGSFGIGLVRYFRFGGSTHFIIDRATKSSQTTDLGSYSFKVSGDGQQVYAILAFPPEKFSIEIGVGYYWMNYRINYSSNNLIFSRNWKTQGGYGIGGLSLPLGSDHFKLFGEINLAKKLSRPIPLFYKRIGLRFSF